MPLLLRTRARHLPRSARQLLHPASSHAASARISVLFRAPQPARARPALRRHPHNGIPISIGARFSSINPIRPGPGHAANGQRSLFTGPTRIDSFSLDRERSRRGGYMRAGGAGPTGGNVGVVFTVPAIGALQNQYNQLSSAYKGEIRKVLSDFIAYPWSDGPSFHLPLSIGHRAERTLSPGFLICFHYKQEDQIVVVAVSFPMIM